MTVSIEDRRNLAGGERRVHLWQVDAAGVSDDVDFDAVLNNFELSRAGRLRDYARREQFLFSRLAVRCVLAGYQNLAPKDVIWHSEGGQPPSADGVSISLAHSGRRTVVALAGALEVALVEQQVRIGVGRVRLGVDYEVDGQQVREETLRTFCDAAGSPLDPDRDVLAQWVEREATYKCCGQWPISKQERKPLIVHGWKDSQTRDQDSGTGALVCDLSGLTDEPAFDLAAANSAFGEFPAISAVLTHPIWGSQTA